MPYDQQFTFGIPFPEELPRLITIEGRIPKKGRKGYDQMGKFLCYLEELGRNNNEDPVKLIIESAGGNRNAMMMILEKMSVAPYPIYTITRNASSAAALIFISGAKGHRYIFKNSRVMLHAGKIVFPYPWCLMPRWISKKFYSEADLAEKELNKINRSIASFLLWLTEEKILTFLGDCGNVSNEEEQIQGVLALLNKDKYFSAEESIEYGLADHIIDEEMFEELFLK